MRVELLMTWRAVSARPYPGAARASGPSASASAALAASPRSCAAGLSAGACPAALLDAGARRLYAVSRRHPCDTRVEREGAMSTAWWGASEPPGRGQVQTKRQRAAGAWGLYRALPPISNRGKCVNCQRKLP